MHKKLTIESFIQQGGINNGIYTKRRLLQIN